MMNSFVYMFKADGFWKKYFSLFGILFIANTLINCSGLFSNGGETSIWLYILLFAGLIVMFIPYGYSISLLKAKLDNASLNEIPSIDFRNNFISGFKVILSGLILFLAVILFVSLLFILNGYLYNFLGGFLSLITNILLFFGLFTVLFLFISMCCRYVVKPSFLNFLNFKAAIQLINSDVLKYFKSFLMFVLCSVILNMITVLSVSVLTKIGYFGLVIYCIIVSLIWAYQIYLYAGLFSHAVVSDKI